MTAYETFEYDKNNQVSMVAPALPQEIWADQVFQFLDALKQELERFDDPDVRDEVSGAYADGSYDSAEQLNLRFKEIFGVVVK